MDKIASASKTGLHWHVYSLIQIGQTVGPPLFTTWVDILVIRLQQTK
jgi:hypothetical protein